MKKVWIRHKRKFPWESKRNQAWDPETTKIHSQPRAIGSTIANLNTRDVTMPYTSYTHSLNQM